MEPHRATDLRVESCRTIHAEIPSAVAIALAAHKASDLYVSDVREFFRSIDR